MRVDRTGHLSAVAKGEKRAGGAGGAFSLEEVAVPARSAPSRQVSGVASLQALIGVQMVEDERSRRRRAVGRGDAVLGLLEDVKLGLLAGRLSPGKLEQLAHLVGEAREDVDDPGLLRVLDEIELRARVELAKFGRPVREAA